MIFEYNLFYIIYTIFNKIKFLKIEDIKCMKK